MPESETTSLDYYPDGWTEVIHGPSYVEWWYNKNNPILVRVEVDDTPPDYYVTAIAGTNSKGEENHVAIMNDLAKSSAYKVAQNLMYAMNGIIHCADELYSESGSSYQSKSEK